MFRIIKWLIALPIGIFIFFNAYVYGNIITYRAVAPSKTAFMSMRMSQFAKEGRDVELDYRWVPYDQISVNLKKALIASEDANFAEHGGFDWNGIKYAMKRNKQSGEVKAGGSTISQQLAKKPVSQRKSQLHPQRRRSGDYRDDGSSNRQRPHF